MENATRKVNKQSGINFSRSGIRARR